MQPHGEVAGAQARQLAVDPGLRLIETPADHQRKPLRKPTHGGLVGEPNRAAAQSLSIVDPNGVGSGDQDVGGAVGAQQRLEDAGTGEFRLQDPQIAQHLGVAEDATGFRADGRGDHVRPQ